jgi:hypothetical protein
MAILATLPVDNIPPVLGVAIALAALFALWWSWGNSSS